MAKKHKKNKKLRRILEEITVGAIAGTIGGVITHILIKFLG